MSINIEKKPFSKTEYYGGQYIHKTEQGGARYLFTLIANDENTNDEVHWLEDVKPANHKEIEAEIIKEFQSR